MSNVRAGPLPPLSTSCVFEPSGSGTAGIVTRAPSATASTAGALTPATSALRFWPWRPSPRTSTVWPGIATSGETAVVVVAAAAFPALLPAAVADCPAAVVTDARSVGVLRSTKYQTRAQTSARAATPPRIGTTGRDGIWKLGFDFDLTLPFALPAAGLAAWRAAGRRDGNSAGAASRSTG